jgi:hypothetical protein
MAHAAERGEPVTDGADALARYAPATVAVTREPSIALDAGQVTLASIGAAAVVWCGLFVKGRLKEDAAEKIALAAAVKRSDDALDALVATVADLQVKVAKCEAHREHDGENMKRLMSELAEIKARNSMRDAERGQA